MSVTLDVSKFETFIFFKLETDDNLIEKKENKNSHYVLIGVCCLVIVVAGILFYKTIQSQGPATAGGK